MASLSSFVLFAQQFIFNSRKRSLFVRIIRTQNIFSYHTRTYTYSTLSLVINYHILHTMSYVNICGRYIINTHIVQSLTRLLNQIQIYMEVYMVFECLKFKVDLTYEYVVDSCCFFCKFKPRQFPCTTFIDQYRLWTHITMYHVT